MTRTSWARSCVIAVVMLIAIPVWSQDLGSRPTHVDTSWGLRVGFGVDPDQRIVGAQYDFGPVAKRVHFDPNVEFARGDDTQVLSSTAAFFYVWGWMGNVRPYAGGGPAIGLVHHDRPRHRTDFEIDLKAMGGGRWKLKSGREFFLELDLGLFGDLHDIQVMAGWRF